MVLFFWKILLLSKEIIVFNFIWKCLFAGTKCCHRWLIDRLISLLSEGVLNERNTLEWFLRKIIFIWNTCLHIVKITNGGIQNEISTLSIFARLFFAIFRAWNEFKCFEKERKGKKNLYKYSNYSNWLWPRLINPHTTISPLIQTL